MSKEKAQIESPQGTLAVLLPGLGAVSTTFIAGVELCRKGLSVPVGSLTQTGTIRLGKRTEERTPLIREFVPLASINDLVFAGWDIFEDNAYASAVNSGVLRREHLDQVKDELETVKPMKAVFSQDYVKRLDGPNVKKGKTKYDLAMSVMEDIQKVMENAGAKRAVMIWCGSTEVFRAPADVHNDIDSLEKGLKNNDENIPPSMIYAYAAVKSGIPYANGAPNLSVNVPALVGLARENGVPVAGKDFKTGQTLLKTILAPGFKARMLGLNGWFSTNILGNRDGEVLDDPGSFKTKEESKLSVLEQILQPNLYPDLYADCHHKVRINYYPPRGDNKEGWDNIDIFGWLGYPMQIKVNFLCRDSILAAPIVLDLAMFLDLAKRAGMHGGIQEWLSFYFKSPITPQGLYPEHDLFIQLKKLKNTLRHLMGEDLITHLGLEYYD